MKQLLLLLIPVLLWACQTTEEEKTPITGETSTETRYDSTLAKELGADNYGMTQYVMAFLKKGPNRSKDSLTSANLQAAHLENIEKLVNAGKLILAGPFLDGGDVRGIYVFNVKSVDEARALTETDPAIKAGSLVMELHPWYGSAALKKVTDIHYKIMKEGS